MTYSSYQLLIQIDRKFTAQIGKLGTFSFAKGYYIYSGSAKQNLKSRLNRHLRKTKKKHWHLDYITMVQSVHIIGIHLSIESECQLNQQVDGLFTIAGFGSSDCPNNCIAHLQKLVYTPNPDRYIPVQKALAILNKEK